MIKNYIKAAFRSIKRFKLHSAINIGGLALGISVFTLIIIYVISELTYDRYHENYDQIYRATVYNELETTAHLGHVLRAQFPEIRYLARIDTWYGGGDRAYLKQADSKELIEFEKIIYADPDFFEIFSVTPLSGNLNTALTDPYSMALTESTAIKLFGSIDVLNKSIGFISADGDIKKDFTITAVIADTPGNSSLQYSAIASFITLNDIQPGGIEANRDYYNWGYHTYLMLNENILVSEFVEKASAYYVKVNSEISGFDPSDDEADEYRLGLISLGEVPFFGNNKKQFLSLVLLIGIAIIILALINFINLSLARSSLRSKEIGYRKAAGASFKDLIVQFIGETTVLVFIAVFISMILTECIKPLFNDMVGKDLSIGYIDKPQILLIFLAGSIILGVLAGIYPAIVLSRYMPVKTIKNEMTTGRKGSFIKQSLSIVQISIALTLIIGMVLISKQIKYMKTLDLGFDNTNIIYFSSNDDIHEKYETFKQRILANPAIYGMSRAGNEFGDPYHITLDDEFKGVRKSFDAMVADPDFVETMGLEISQGRNYQWNRTNDVGGLIINETAAKEFGLDSIIGHRITTMFGSQEILGIYRDIHNESFHEDISPSALMNLPYMLHKVIIKIDPNNRKTAINQIEMIWNEFVPDIPFTYGFLEEKYHRLYDAETRFGKVIGYAALLSVLLACLGLFGLVSYNTETRVKEIGIRKANGATATDILILFDRAIVRWVGIACVLAIPLSYFAINKWLQNFAYRTPISIGMTALAIFIVLAISLFAVFIVVLKAAKTSPAECLRTE